MAGAFVPQTVGAQDCTDKLVTGTKSTLYSYIAKPSNNDTVEPSGIGEIPPCDQYYHGNAQIDNLQVNTEINGAGDIDITGDITTTGTITGDIINAVSSVNATVKAFNIQHPTKKDKRLVHGCLEGPENGVYVRGRLTDNSVIELPEYWMGLVDPESITVSLTQIGSSQDLIVDKIEWGRKVMVRSGNASKIDCFYTVNATRKDVPPLEVEQDA